MVIGWVAGLSAAAVLLELELRRVEQAPVDPGVTLSSRAGLPRGPQTLSSGAGPRIEPLGPQLRVQSGSTAQWQLQLEQAPLWAQVVQGPARVELPLGSGPQRWLLEATPQWRGTRQPQLLQLHWQQPLAEGGSQHWRSTLPLAEGLWVTVARQGRAAARPAPGTLSSSERADPVIELQVRVRRVEPE